MDIPPVWLQGVFAVLPTPMLGDGDLDMESLDRVVDHYLRCGATGLVPVSIAGEGDRLDEDERLRVVRRVVQHARGRAPVVPGVLATDHDGALAQARMAAECGAQGLLVKPPMGTHDAVMAHFAALGQLLGLPIVLLDYPKAGPLLPVELIHTLVERVPEVCGIKLEDEPTPVKMARLRATLGARMRIFGGLCGAYCLQELEQGADGFFTGCPHPDLLVEAMVRYHQHDLAGATAAFESLRPTIERERRQPDGLSGQRKAILCELGILREAAVRMPGYTRSTVLERR